MFGKNTENDTLTRLLESFRSSGRFLICLVLVGFFISFLTGCSILGLDENKEKPEEDIPAEITLSKASDEDCFVWSGTTLIGLTEKGKTESNIVIPQKATQIKEELFSGSTTLKTIGFQNPDIILGEGLFADCEFLAKALLPASIKEIPASLFKGCRSLTEITIPAQVTSIGEMSFYQCVSLETATHGTKIATIGRQAFHTCDKLKEFEFSPSITFIGEGAFSWCSSLESVILTSERLTNLEKRTFSNCDKLTVVIIPEGVEKFAEGVFAYCPKLIDITLPASLIEIDPGAFNNTAAINSQPRKFKVKKGSTAEKSFQSYSHSEDVKELYQ